MSSVEVPLGTLIVCATGRLLDHVVNVMPFENEPAVRPSCASYVVPGVRFTRLPRHSPLEASYQRFSPSFQVAEPCLRNCTTQPLALAPAFAQYRPTASYVGTARMPLESRACACAGAWASERPTRREEAAMSPRARLIACLCIGSVPVFVATKGARPLQALCRV